jgi:glutathione S-transferase
MKLYGAIGSPFVRMSMVTAIECDLAGRVQLIPTSAGPAEVNTELQKLSPIAKIPVLETDHGHALYDSRVIMEYFTHSAGNTNLLPHEGVARFGILTLLALAQGMSEAAVGLRYEQAARPQGLQWKDWMDRAVARINASVDELETNWRDTLSELNLGSIAVAVTLSYIDYRHGALNWRKDRANLTQFHEAFSKRISMMNTALPTA